jgi:hypothetical protein
MLGPERSKYDMSSDKLARPAPADTGPWYAAVRYGVAQELKKRLEPTEAMPQRFRQLIIALQQAEQGRETDRRRVASELAVRSEA